MRCKYFAHIIILILTFSALHAQKAKQVNGKENCSVTYIANEGFLVETKNSKLLLDALFGDIKGDWCDQPATSTSEQMINGAAPFDNIDFIFVSHYHVDHFNKNMVVNFLKNNKRAVLICPGQVNTALKDSPDYPLISNRINSLIPGESFDSRMNYNKIKVRALRINHGAYYLKDSLSGEYVNIHKNVENLAYIIESDGFKFLHTGDGSPADKKHFENYNIKNESLDVTFLDRIFLNTDGMDIRKDFLRTRYLMYMHIEPGNRSTYKSMKNYPDDKFKLLTLYDLMEKIIISK